MKQIHLLIGIFLFFLIYFLGGTDNQFYNAIALGALVVYWWISEPIPLYVTALVPIIVGPILGLVSIAELESSYGNKMVFLFLGGFLIALAIEKWDLHKKIAFMIIQRTGSSPAGVLLGFILSTAFLSMWLSNTGTTIMMLPMTMTVLKSLPLNNEKFTEKFSIALLLGVAFAASIGGTATLVGSPPNIQMAGILEQNYHIKVDFMTWTSIGLPFSICMLTILFFYLKWRFINKADNHIQIQVENHRGTTKNQQRILLIFLFTIVMWSVKQFINEAFHWKISDTEIALFGALLLFIIPSNENKKEGILVWEDTKELPWGILILFGGGLALASILSNGGVLKAFAHWIETTHFSSYFILVMALVIVSILLTELMSNLALVTVLIPIVAELGQTMGYSILSLCIPVTLAASCAFMLPMSTPPNAIVFASGRIKVKTMAKVGSVLNLVSILVIGAFAYIISIFFPL